MHSCSKSSAFSLTATFVTIDAFPSVVQRVTLFSCLIYRLLKIISTAKNYALTWIIHIIECNLSKEQKIGSLDYIPIISVQLQKIETIWLLKCSWHCYKYSRFIPVCMQIYLKWIFKDNCKERIVRNLKAVIFISFTLKLVC